MNKRYKCSKKCLLTVIITKTITINIFILFDYSIIDNKKKNYIDSLFVIDFIDELCYNICAVLFVLSIKNIKLRC